MASIVIFINKAKRVRDYAMLHETFDGFSVLLILITN